MKTMFYHPAGTILFLTTLELAVAFPAIHPTTKFLETGWCSLAKTTASKSVVIISATTPSMVAAAAGEMCSPQVHNNVEVFTSLAMVLTPTTPPPFFLIASSAALPVVIVAYLLLSGKWVPAAGGVASVIYDKIYWFQKLFAENARAPSNNHPMGWLLQKAMAQMNADRSIQVVDTLHPPSNSSIVVEIGPGNGFSLEHVLEQYAPSRVYGIEISDRFRNILQDKFHREIQQGILSIHNQDARDLAFIQDNSVDGGVYALNVIYFLNPLSAYLQEIYRVLQPGAKVVFGVNAEAQAFRDETYFVNVDWEKCLEGMVQAGFRNVEITKPQDTKVGSKLVSLIGVKPKE